MAVKRLSNSLISSSGRDKMSSFIAGYSPGVDEMDLIQRITVTSANSTTIDFSNIPQTYQHLQIRGICRVVSNVYYQNIRLEFNQDTTATNYTKHWLGADGSTISSTGVTDANGLYFFYTTASLAGSNLYCATIINILDYTNTSKNKIVFGQGGYDNNGLGTTYQRGLSHLTTGSRMNTSAINKITLNSATFDIGTQYSLYGVIA